MIHHRLFGAAHLDRIGRLEAPAMLAQSNPGQFAETPGGAAFNIACSLAAMGAHASLTSAIAEDAAGNRVCKAANERNIAFGNTARGGSHPTATYTAILDPGGELVIAVADMQIYSAFDCSAGAIAPTDWLTIDANLPPGAIAALLDREVAHRAAATVSAAKAQRLRPHMHRLDLLLTNRAETAALCEMAEETPITSLAAELSSLGCARAVISDGAEPIYLLENGRTAACEVPACTVIDVTGAGDALAAGVLLSLSRGSAFADAAAFGARVAQSVLGVVGPYRADLSKVVGDGL